MAVQSFSTCGVASVPTSLKDLMDGEKHHKQVRHWVCLHVVADGGPELLNLWSCECADAKAHSHDQCPDRGAANEFRRLKEVGERLPLCGRLEDITAKLVSRC